MNRMLSPRLRFTRGWAKTTATFLVAALALTSGCSSVDTLKISQNDYSATPRTNSSAPVVTLFPTDDQSALATRKADPTLLGKTLSAVILIGYVPIIGIWLDYHGDESRASLISSGVQATLSKMEIPVVVQDEGHEVPDSQADQLGLYFHIRDFYIDSFMNRSLLTIIVNGMYFDGLTVRVGLDCELKQPGSSAPISQASGSSNTGTPHNPSIEDSDLVVAIHSAVDQAVSQCISGLNIPDARENIQNQRYAKLMSDAREQETARDAEKAFDSYGRAYEAAATDDQTAAAAKGIVRFMEGAPDGPEYSAYVHVATSISPESKLGRFIQKTKADEELAAALQRGDHALESGDAAGALAAYTLALKSLTSGSGRVEEIQEKQVEAASRLNPRPPVPEDVKAVMAQGKAYVTAARGPEDFVKGAKEMKKALGLAPWWAAGYFNEALAEEGAGEWADAQKDLKIYLKLNPDAEDKDKVIDKIALLKVHEDRGDAPPGQN